AAPRENVSAELAWLREASQDDERPRLDDQPIARLGFLRRKSEVRRRDHHPPGVGDGAVGHRELDRAVRRAEQQEEAVTDDRPAPLVRLVDLLSVEEDADGLGETLRPV